jgi:hypothetical protein
LRPGSTSLVGPGFELLGWTVGCQNEFSVM